MPAQHGWFRARWGAAAMALALLGGCTGSSDAPTGEPAPLALPTTVPARTGILVLPVIPVGGDLGSGRQTEESALAAVDAIADTDAAGIRLAADLRWLCESEECDTSPLDPVVQHALEHGLRVYLQVNSTPEWMDERGRWYAPEGDDAEVWADLFAQVVARYGTAVSGYDVWNEPNLQEFWEQGPDPEAYADLLEAVWTAVEDVDPAAVLVGGVLSNNDLGFMRQLDRALAERGGSRENGYFYDVLGVHPYAGGEGYGLDPSAEPGSDVAESPFGPKDMTFLGIDRLRAQVAQDEGIDRTVMIGEFGYDLDHGAWYHVSEPQRAEFLGTALELAQDRSWIDAFVPYSYTQGSGDGFGIRGTPSETALQDAASAAR